MLSQNNSDPSLSLKIFQTTVLLLLIFFTVFSCGQSKESSSEKIDKKTGSPLEMEESNLPKLDPKDSFQNENQFTPTNPITDISSERLLEYKIYIVLKNEDLLSSRKELLSIIQKTSILKKSDFSMQNEFETFQMEVLTPITNLYSLLIQISKIGRLLSEKVETIDWTEHNQKQKITLERESLRAQRRAKAGQEGSATNWTWKEREELLERSENNYDIAKLETWKIQDSIRWAKIYIQIEGKEVPIQIQFPNVRNAFISGLNFIFRLLENIVWLLTVFLVFIILYIAYKRYKNWY